MAKYFASVLYVVATEHYKRITHFASCALKIFKVLVVRAIEQSKHASFDSMWSTKTLSIVERARLQLAQLKMLLKLVE